MLRSALPFPSAALSAPVGRHPWRHAPGLVLMRNRPGRFHGDWGIEWDVTDDFTGPHRDIIGISWGFHWP